MTHLLTQRGRGCAAASRQASVVQKVSEMSSGFGILSCSIFNFTFSDNFLLKFNIQSHNFSFLRIKTERKSLIFSRPMVLFKLTELKTDSALEPKGELSRRAKDRGMERRKERATGAFLSSVSMFY